MDRRGRARRGGWLCGVRGRHDSLGVGCRKSNSILGTCATSKDILAALATRRARCRALRLLHLRSGLVKVHDPVSAAADHKDHRDGPQQNGNGWHGCSPLERFVTGERPDLPARSRAKLGHYKIQLRPLRRLGADESSDAFDRVLGEVAHPKKDEAAN
jgi:hypothetical protein